jgi:23S rRNA (cytidine1920-2'-O)/16S rRNA (cytidine1409-2'-O)-methyltransferase
MPKQRLDMILVDRQLCASQQQAQRLIQAGEVKVNHQVIDKPGTRIDTSAIVELKARPPYVSRGGEKLLKALQTFPIDVTDRVCLDGGISTGGFTDCLLQHGAKQVYGVDVGYGQVAWKVRQDPRVVLRERTNLRHLTPEDLYATDADRPDLGVADVSFISLTKVLPAMWALMAAPREIILLVKPQFEVGRDRLGPKGVVRDPTDHAAAIARVLASAQTLGWHYSGLTWSSLVGPAGNIEYLLWMRQDSSAIAAPELATIVDLARVAKQALTKAAPQNDTKISL